MSVPGTHQALSGSSIVRNLLVAMLRSCCEVVAEILCVFPAIDAGCSDVAELSRG